MYRSLSRRVALLGVLAGLCRVADVALERRLCLLSAASSFSVKCVGGVLVLIRAIARRRLAFGEIKSGVRNGEATAAIFVEFQDPSKKHGMCDSLKCFSSAQS